MIGRPAALLLAPVLVLAAAAPASAAPTKTVSPSQHALAVVIDGAAVLARACREAGACDPAGGTRFDIPAEADASKATVEEVRLAGKRRALLVAVPAKEGAGRWLLLLHASASDEAPAVREQLRGFVDQSRAQRSGEAAVSVLLREPAPGGGEVLFVGKRYDGIDLCGRPAILGVRRFDAATLEWESAATRSLGESDIKAAAPVVAVASSAPLELGGPRVLQATAASSAVGHAMNALTDRDLATRWSEAKDGGGAGELVVMNASDAVPINGFDLVVRPSGSAAAVAAPRTVYIATRSEVFAVTLPADAGAQPAGTAFGFELPHEVKSDCVALVLGDAATAGDVEVGVAELRARTRLDAEKPADLTRALDDPARGDAAKAMLLRGGESWLRATMDAWDSLGPDGRIRALEVVDAGDCQITAPFYVARLLGKGAAADFHPDIDDLAGHARDRLLRCRPQARDSITAAMRAEPSGETRVWAARELALLVPADAVEPILALVGDGEQAKDGDAVRRGLRGALATAARHPRAHDAVAKRLEPAAFTELSLVQRIDLLRSVGKELTGFPTAGAALTAVLEADHSFRTRYLLQEPAAELARGKDERALAFLRESLRRDESPHVRARAARAGAGVGALAADLVAALGDAAPRVREAALEALSATTGTTVDEAPLVTLLADDPWTFVRIGAARALGAQPSSPAGDAALAATLEDAPGPVRRAALEAIGSRGAASAGEAVQAIAGRAKEPIDVRISAIAALGELCREDSAELLYKLALRAGAPQLPYDEKIGLAALHALGEIKPPDLAERLAPLTSQKRVPRTVRALAGDAVGRKSKCHRPS